MTSLVGVSGGPAGWVGYVRHAGNVQGGTRMAAQQTVFQVTPEESHWRIDRDGESMLVVQTKDVAVEEAVVQARQVPQGRVVICTADGTVEEEAAYRDGTPVTATV